MRALAALTLLGVWVFLWLWVKAFPPTEKRPSAEALHDLEPTRKSTKRLRDGTRITTRVYPSERTGRAYRRTTTKPGPTP